MKQLHAAIAIDLPADQFEEAAAKLAFKAPWDAFLDGLVSVNIKHTVQLDTTEVRTKTLPTGAKRGRKPKERLPTIEEVRGILAPEAAE